MTTFNTGNPLGSSDPRDLYDNAENLDEFVNSAAKDVHPDRLGVSRKTWHGMESEFDAAQANKQLRFNQFLAASGYEFIGDYAAGITITEYNQVIRDVSGELWRLNTTEPLGYVTTGVGLPENGKFLSVGDGVLRQELQGDGGARLVGNAAIVFDTVADMIAAEWLVGGKCSTGATVWRIGASGSLALDSGLYAQPLNGAHLIDFGLNADGITDDKEAIDLWGSVQSALIGFPADVAYSGKGIVRSANKFRFKGRGLTINKIGANEYYFLLVELPSDSDKKSVEVSGLTLNANGLYSTGVRVQALSGASAADRIIVSDVIVKDLDNAVLASITASVGVSVSAPAKLVEVSGCNLENIKRTQVNPGSTASVGISVTNAIGIVDIHNNTIDTVVSPTGDADADGISVFYDSRRLGSTPINQTIQPRIYNNKLKDCKGRFVKLQCANALVYGNEFVLEGIEIITNWTGVDAQIGGAKVFKNTFRLEYTGGGSAALMKAQGKDVAKENCHEFTHNDLYLITRTTYGVIATPSSGSKYSVKFSDNTLFLESLSRCMYIEIDENIAGAEFEVSRNKFNKAPTAIIDYLGRAGGRDNVLDPVKGPVIASKTTYVVTDNIAPTAIEFTVSPNFGAYFGRVKFSGNVESFVMKLDIKDVIVGSSFYYTNDGGSGGLGNAPSGVGRNVMVEAITSVLTRLTYITGSPIVNVRLSNYSFEKYTADA